MAKGMYKALVSGGLVLFRFDGIKEANGFQVCGGSIINCFLLILAHLIGQYHFPFIPCGRL